MQKYAYMSLLIKKNNNCAWKGQNTANIGPTDAVIYSYEEELNLKECMPNYYVHMTASVGAIFAVFWPFHAQLLFFFYK